VRFEGFASLSIIDGPTKKRQHRFFVGKPPS
jgi:hypothetical protein